MLNNNSVLFKEAEKTLINNLEELNKNKESKNIPKENKIIKVVDKKNSLVEYKPIKCTNFNAS